MDVIQDLIQQPTSDESILAELIRQYRISASATYAEKQYLLERDGVGFCPRGNVMAISAEKKAGKTWFCMAMCSALLCGDYLGMKAREERCKVLYIDTEQDEVDGQRIQKRVHYACNWDFEIDHDEFSVFHLREINADERRKVVCQAVELMKPDMVIVDGIRDLLTDFNDLEQSASVIQDFMRLSSELNCAIWAVLHVNPNSEKMRGHLGTELGNKVADIIHMTKQKSDKDEDNVTYKAEEVAARSHKDIHSITFRIDDSKPYGMPVMLGEEEIQVIDNSRKDTLRNIFEKYINDNRAYSKTSLQTQIKNGENVGSTKAWKMVEEAIKMEVIEQVIGGKYRMKTKQTDSSQNEMPF